MNTATSKQEEGASIGSTLNGDIFKIATALNTFRLQQLEAEEKSMFNVQERAFIRTMTEQIQHYGAEFKPSAVQIATMKVLKDRVVQERGDDPRIAALLGA